MDRAEALITPIITFLIIFQAKHWLADYPFQIPWMLQKFRADWSFLLPLAVHAAVHGSMTFVIAGLWCGATNLGVGLALKVAALDFVVHFTMDRVKAGPRYLGRFKPLFGSEYLAAQEALQLGIGYGYDRAVKNLRANKYFWLSLGFDQAVHHLTHYWIIYQLVTA